MSVWANAWLAGQAAPDDVLDALAAWAPAHSVIAYDAEARVVQIDGHSIDVPPAANLMVVRNDDRPGVIGRVGTILGDAGVNIADMDVGRSAHGESALMVIATTEPVPAEVLEALRTCDGISSVAVA